MKRRVFLASGTAMVTIAADQWVRFPSGEALPTGRASAQPVLNLYSARHYDSDTKIYDSFTKKTGIKVNLIEAQADKLIERIKSEGAKSPVDVILTVDAGNLWLAQSENLLQSVSSPVLDKLDKSLRDPQGYWFGFTKRARVILYNKAKVNPNDIKRYEELADSKWNGKILVRSSGNVYNQSLVGSLIKHLGASETEKWAKAVVSNFARQPEGNDTAQIKALAAGQGTLAIANTYYLVRLAKSDKPEDREIASKVGIIFPNQSDRGTHVNICGGGVVKTAPNRDAAIKFLEHLASPDSQEIFAKSNNEYPVVSGVSIDSKLDSYGKFKSDTLNVTEFGSRNKEALQLMNRAGWK